MPSPRDRDIEAKEQQHIRDLVARAPRMTPELADRLRRIFTAPPPPEAEEDGPP